MCAYPMNGCIYLEICKTGISGWRTNGTFNTIVEGIVFAYIDYRCRTDIKIRRNNNTVAYLNIDEREYY
jgi:hypothetical protein